MRILLVEDDAMLAGVVARGLREEGHAVDLADTAAAADELLTLSPYDVLVLDVGLPDGSGLDLCAQARALDHPARVLLMTARDSLSDVVGGLDAGADDYLTKPFRFPELAARVRALLRRPGGSGSPVLACGDIRLDPAAHTAWRGSLLVPLTAREFSLLHYLLARAGEVVTRTDLVEHVWDGTYDAVSNTVDVHVAALRRKLALPGSPAPLETVRGVGYRLGSGGQGLSGTSAAPRSKRSTCGWND